MILQAILECHIKSLSMQSALKSEIISRHTVAVGMSLNEWAGQLPCKLYGLDPLMKTINITNHGNTNA